MFCLFVVKLYGFLNYKTSSILCCHVFTYEPIDIALMDCFCLKNALQSKPKKNQKMLFFWAEGGYFQGDGQISKKLGTFKKLVSFFKSWLRWFGVKDLPQD